MNINYDLILSGKDEFYPDLSNKKYYILKIDNTKKEEFMIKTFNNFIINQNKNPNEKHYIGIDFEFNKISKTDRDVALMQINLENDSDNGMIFILYPPKLKQNNIKILIKLLTHTKIIKILHGAESLDIPYLFNQLLITKQNIDNFSKNFYDTKYLCDYYFLEKSTKGKCGIYDMLLDNNIITQQKMDELNKLADDIGPLYFINIDIYNLSNKLGQMIFRYSLYDVIYLPELIKKLSSYGVIYSNVIPEISSIINKYKRGFINELNELDSVLREYNNYYLPYGNKKVILAELWGFFLYYIDYENNYIFHLKDINYFKSFITLITKLVIYKNLIIEYDTFKNKDTRVLYNNQLLKYYNIFKKYPEFNKLLIEYDKIFKKELKNL